MRLSRFARATAVTAVVAALTAAVLVAPARPQGGASAAAAVAVPDGSTSAEAAASCWEIVQAYPQSPSGSYWLQTPQLVAPAQFHCDMTTDGGGWVLVGRGRDGWSFAHGGQGTAGAVRTVVSGPQAFSPAALPADTVDGLLGGQRVDALPDGIRVRRATLADGSAWQEMRLRATSRQHWSWAFGGGIRLSSVTVDGTTYAGGSTQSWAVSGNQGLLRLTTTDQVAHNYRKGFSYGSAIAGVNDATSHLWTYTTEKSALPFAQVYLRPRLTSPAYPAIADSGVPASTVRPMMSNTTADTPWGVTGVVGGGTGELNMEVEDLVAIGDTMFVGGKFQFVQKGPTPAAGEKVEQSYLAAFDARTGEWIPSFRPVLNGMVWALAATPDGKLVVGGDFTSVNGQPATSYLAALDPASGQLAAGWRAPITQPAGSTIVPRVRSLDVQDGWVYATGRFTRIAGGVPLSAPLTLSAAARVSAVDGRPDPQWKPHVDGTVFSVDASERGDRVYLAGKFNNVNFQPSVNRGVVTTAPGAAQVPGLNDWVRSSGTEKTYQQAVLEVGDQVWMGGSEHILGHYGRDTFSFKGSSITRNGGDFQALAEVDGIVYAACHCIHYAYSGTNNYGSPVGAAADVNPITFIGAWDAVTGEYLPEFAIGGLSGRNDMGPWGFSQAPDGCLWFGGDFVRGSFRGSSYQWLGGFGRVCPRDAQAPTTPTGLTAARTASGVSLTWGASSDAAGAVQYEVLRDDRVVTVVTGRSWVDTTATLPARYWVRAVDAQGNRSATTAAAVVQAPDTTAPTVTVTSPDEGTSVHGSVRVTAAAEDDRGVVSGRLLVDGVVVATTTTLPLAFDADVTAVGEHRLEVVATDAAGNTGRSAPVTVAVLPDTSAPSAVTGLTVTGVTPDSVSLEWAAASDDRGVAAYQVVRDGVPLAGTQAGTSFTDTALAPSTPYTYEVLAVDAAGNTGPAGTPVTATTKAAPSVLFQESFDGADGTAWRSPWLTTAGGGGSARTTAGAGVLLHPDTAGAFARAQLDLPARADSEVLLGYRWSDTGPQSFLNVYLRGSGGWQNGYRPRNGYGVQLTSSTGTLQVHRNVNGTLTTLRSVTGAQAPGTGLQMLRVRVVGQTLQVRTWAAGQPEPGTWTASVTDTAVTAAGQLHLSLNRGGSNVGPRSVSIEDLTVRDGTS